MSNRSEIGHGQNVANFEDLISRCIGYGSQYNPSLNSIKITSLNTLRVAALSILSTNVSAKTASINAINNKEIVFKPLKLMATRIMNALKASGAGDHTIKDARSINYKIQGVRVKAIEINENASDQTKHISVSRQSVDSMIEHFEKLIDLLNSVPNYQPNENELSITGLNALLVTMKTVNTNVINTTTDLINSIIARNELLYQKQTGLVFIANEVKFYIKSVFGSKSSEYKEVSKIKFTLRKIN